MSVGQSLKDQLVAQMGAQGSLYHAFSEIANKGKWIAVLNAEWPPADGLIVYAFMTSSIDRFARVKIPPTAYLPIEIGSYDFCKEPTILDLTDIHRRPTTDMTSAAMFKYCGTLTAQHLKQVLEIVASSTYVSKVHKRSILGRAFTG